MQNGLCEVPTGGTIAMAVIFGILGFAAALVYFGKLEGGPVRRSASRRSASGWSTWRPASPSARAGRSAATSPRILSGSICYLGYFWMLWDPQKQTWHDKIVNSVVVKVLIPAISLGAVDLTTVADDEVVLHDGVVEHRHTGLEPDTPYALDGHELRTLARPPGERLATVCTVNDVHFGEVECGILNGVDDDPIYTTAPGDEPYPDLMNRCAVDDIRAVDPDAVVVKGDLTSMGTRAEYQAFLNAYGPAFGDRLLHVRGNHDAYHGEDFASRAPLSTTLPGRDPGRDRHGGPGSAPVAACRPTRSNGSTRWPPRPTGR